MIINGTLDLSYSNIESLGNIERINGDLELRDCLYLFSFGKLKYATSISIYNTPKLKSFPNDLQISEIYSSDKEINFFKNFEGLKNLKLLNIRSFDFTNIPNWLTKDILKKIKFLDIRILKKDLKKLEFSSNIINENNFNFINSCFKEVIYNSDSPFKFKLDFEFNSTLEGFEILFTEKWNSYIYSHEYNKVKIILDYNILKGVGFFTIDGSNLMGSENNVEEDEDLEDLSFIYEVPNIKINSLDDILDINSSDKIIRIGERMGIRYDY